MSYIVKLKMSNFKRFKGSEIQFNEGTNLLIGDNEAGKSSILEAINFVLNGSRNKIETYGLENLFNSEIVDDFKKGSKKYDDLPKLWIELYFNEQNIFELNGDNNSDDKTTDGIKLKISPDDDLSKEINDIIQAQDFSFPFEYYKIKFSTFSGESYSGYKKYIKHIFIDNSQINNEFAMREYIKDVYNKQTTSLDKNKHHNEYRKHKKAFESANFTDLNNNLSQYQFVLRNNTKSNLETDLALAENNINLENKGKGTQNFIKTAFALNKGINNLDLILLEEPENHLSHLNMKKMIQNLAEKTNCQIFITTHNSLISSRLNLKNAIMINSNSETHASLAKIDGSTADFFMKAPDNNLLEFVLSKKVLLVEGDAEYILMDEFFKRAGYELASSDVHIISVGGTSFKRYLEIAKFLNIKTAVIRDNDGDYQKNCVDFFGDYLNYDFIKIFSENNNDIKTFEVSIYECNKTICDDLFLAGRKTLSVQDYMLENKAGVALKILEKKTTSLCVPEYIKEAILWINA